MENIEDVNEYLSKFYRGTKNPSLKAMRYFMDIYDNFEKDMKFIHVAGTNGKGSCVEMLSSILINEGYKVGKFISPHLIRYNERISINGKEISDDDMLKLIRELNPAIEEYNKNEDMHITLFELETTMALLYFYRNNVDFVVLETGLGGLYDCTNVIAKPLVSIITSIGYDHMNILGNTLQEIAYQKAGIIKMNSNTVIFESTPEIDSVFTEQCKNKNNKLHLIKKNDISNYHYDSDYQYFNYKNIDNIKINLKGQVQIKNASICIETVNILNDLGYKVSNKSIKNGLKMVIHKGRMEKINDAPIIIYDGAHNEPAIVNIKNMVDMYYNNYKRTYIISILQRKDYKTMLKVLAKDLNANFILTSGNDADIFVSSDELFQCLKEYVPLQNICECKFSEAIDKAMNGDLYTVYFVVGSFYVYDTAMKVISKNKIKGVSVKYIRDKINIKK